MQKKLWSKKFIPPAQWEIEALPTDEELPEILLMELLGSRNKILFCEGEKSSLDYKLYRILFPDFTIIPVGGHINVINYTKAFNNSQSIHENEAMGIIDGDYHIPEAIGKWKTDSIFCIGVQEVENLLCDELLLNAAKEQFLSEDGSVEEAKEKLFATLSKDIDKQALEYATQQANNLFKNNLLHKQNDLKSLKASIDNIQNILDVETLFTERTTLLKTIIDSKNYTDGLRYCNLKGLIGIIPIGIEKDYRVKVFNLLRSKYGLSEEFRKKHFSMIPQYTGESRRTT